MKKIVMLMIAAIMTFLLIACSDSQTHDGEAKTPSASGAQKGRDYQSVVEDFEERGFTNISLVALDDLITGWLTKDGEVENVSVDGDENYSADKWYSNDVEVIITYHTFSEESDLEEDEESKESISEKYIDCYEERGLKWPFSLLFWRKEAHLCWKANFRTSWFKN